MFSATPDRIAAAMRLLAVGVGIAADPTLLSAVIGALSAYDAVKRIAAAPPPSIAGLAKTLAGEARALFAATRDLPPDADVLYLQMVEAGMVGAPEIVAADMDPTAVVEAMAGKLTDPEHRAAPMLRLFRTLTVPVLERLFADKAFAADLTPAFMQRVLGGIADLSAKLDDIAGQSRDTLELMALHFGEPEPEAMPLADLKALLIEKAKDYRALQAEVEALRGMTPQIDKVLAEVEAALERPDLEEAERLLAGIRKTAAEALRKPVEDIARIMEAQARVALLRGAAGEAFTILSAAADGFASLDPLEPVRRRLDYSGTLQEQGQRYGGSGIANAVRMIRRALDDLPEREHAELWAAAQNNLGTALCAQGGRLGGKAGAHLLGAAVAAYRAASLVWTEATHPVEWATTQNNLGNALRAQGERIGWMEGARLLDEAVAAFRAALRVRTEATHPVDWALTQNNLGIALRTQGEWIGGLDGARLLSEAVVAGRASLRVLTETAQPSDWARAQSNLGIALRAQGERVGGTPGAKLLGEAVASFRAALRVWTEAAHPVAWAAAQNNLGNALQAQGKRVGEPAGEQLLNEALGAYRVALRVRTETAHPVDWAMTMGNLGLVHEALAEIGDGDGRVAALADSATCFEAALRVFVPEHMPLDHARAMAALTRVRRKLGDCA